MNQNMVLEDNEIMNLPTAVAANKDDDDDEDVFYVDLFVDDRSELIAKNESILCLYCLLSSLLLIIYRMVDDVIYR